MDVSNNWMDDVYLYSDDLSTHFNNADCAANFKRLPWREFYGMRNLQCNFVSSRFVFGPEMRHISQSTWVFFAFNSKG